MHFPDGSGQELHLGQRPFIGAEVSLVFPPPSVEPIRIRKRQLPGRNEVGQQPHIHLPFFVPHAQQTGLDRLETLLLGPIRPVVDQPLAKIGQPPLLFGIQRHRGGHADQEGNPRSDQFQHQIVAVISRVGHDEGLPREILKHLHQMVAFAGLAPPAETPRPRHPRQEVDDRRHPDRRCRVLLAPLAQTLLQLHRPRAFQPRAVTAKRNPSPDPPAVAQELLDPAPDSPGQDTQHGHGQFPHGLLEPLEGLSGPAAFVVADHIESPCCLELLRQRIPATPRHGQKHQQQRPNVPAWHLASACCFPDLLPDLGREKLTKRLQQGFCPRAKSAWLPCLDHGCSPGMDVAGTNQILPENSL